MRLGVRVHMPMRDHVHAYVIAILITRLVSAIAVAVAAAKGELLRGALFSGYLISISLYLLLMALLFAHHSGSIWKATEGMCVECNDKSNASMLVCT